MILGTNADWQPVTQIDLPCETCGSLGGVWMWSWRHTGPNYVEHRFRNLCPACVDRARMEDAL